jgi:hypothetical protein
MQWNHILLNAKPKISMEQAIKEWIKTYYLPVAGKESMGVISKAILFLNKRSWGF